LGEGHTLLKTGPSARAHTETHKSESASFTPFTWQI